MFQFKTPAFTKEINNMISCTEFIPAYSELFNFLEEKGGKAAVEKYWDYITVNSPGIGNLKKIVRENGLKGCYLYWSNTLNEEAADFRMELDEEENEFSIEMRHCPSKGKLLEIKEKFDSYPDYCKHCRIYEKALKPLGYEVKLDLSKTDQASCKLTVKKAQSQA
ncbi:MAG: hypothetical protein ACYTFY_14225 [Planctomycetota bacterium]|jgi:hypothetical protein